MNSRYPEPHLLDFSPVRGGFVCVCPSCSACYLAPAPFADCPQCNPEIARRCSPIAREARILTIGNPTAEGVRWARAFQQPKGS